MIIGNYRSQFREAIRWFWNRSETPRVHWFERINYPDGYWTSIDSPEAKHALILDDELALNHAQDKETK